MMNFCQRCYPLDGTISSAKIFQAEIKEQCSIFQAGIEYICPNCRKLSALNRVLVDTQKFQHVPDEIDAKSADSVIYRQYLWQFPTTQGSRPVFIQYKGAFHAAQKCSVPCSEGNIQDTTIVGRYGDPDLMMETAKSYFQGFLEILPGGYLSTGVVAFLPALNLLINSAELAIKSYLIRNCWSGNQEYATRGHKLNSLYNELEPSQQTEVNRRFSKCKVKQHLARLGISGPSIEDVLKTYDESYEGSSVYIDTRYYCEPITSLDENTVLLKSATPYPIFLPYIVLSLIDTYVSFSGHERLRRMGADIAYLEQDPGGDNHGNWRLIPKSLNLTVLSISQENNAHSVNDKKEKFDRLKSANPLGFTADGKYGGHTLLFYRDGGKETEDGSREFKGVECKIWRHRRLGMHARDLYLLADALENGDPFGYVPDVDSVERGGKPIAPSF